MTAKELIKERDFKALATPQKRMCTPGIKLMCQRYKIDYKKLRVDGYSYDELIQLAPGSKYYIDQALIKAEARWQAEAEAEAE